MLCTYDNMQYIVVEVVVVIFVKVGLERLITKYKDSEAKISDSVFFCYLITWTLPRGADNQSVLTSYFSICNLK